ncbi:hypothetical protein M011DRAFT_468120 [Sporormia fimetaria CBS 119925]|uniref:Uncharacterized protein n=1 Tax=Sporormia fimetaria CBS 119925 TaxID=1340428 RepID=A0A6A6VCJ1_9PLEO|nr:hypothetical protein M011DRAFT_468120 [Sporormia fimetaria CBS 119925]
MPQHMHLALHEYFFGMDNTLTEQAHDSRRESGVTESSIWEDEAMDNMENAIRRLEQLAQDEATKTGKTTQQCFLARLKRAIDSASTLFNGDIQFLGEESANPQ